MFFQHFFNALTLGFPVWPDSHRVHDGVRDIAADQLRPRRRFSCWGLFRLLRHHDILPFRGGRGGGHPRGPAPSAFWWTASPTGPCATPAHFGAHQLPSPCPSSSKASPVVVFSGLPRPVYQPEWLMTPINFGQLKLLPITLVVPWSASCSCSSSCGSSTAQTWATMRAISKRHRDHACSGCGSTASSRWPSGSAPRWRRPRNRVGPCYCRSTLR